MIMRQEWKGERKAMARLSVVVVALRNFSLSPRSDKCLIEKKSERDWGGRIYTRQFFALACMRAPSESSFLTSTHTHARTRARSYRQGGKKSASANEP